MNDRIRVLLVDDHQIVREGLRMLLADEPEIEVVGEAEDGTEALPKAERLQPDVILLDLVMPGVGGFETLHRLRERIPAARVLVLTTFAEDQLIRQAIGAGALGYLLKDITRQELVRAIVNAHENRPSLHPEAQRVLMQREVESSAPSPLAALTPRELDVLAEIAHGKSNRQIASALHLSEGTVKWYVSLILDKLGVEDRTQAALLAVRSGLGE